MKYERFEVYEVNLDPTVGSEIRKRRPYVIISPNEMNGSLRTVIVIPLTSSDKPYPFRVPSKFQDTSGYFALDHIRSVDKDRLIRRLGAVSRREAESLLLMMARIYAP